MQRVYRDCHQATSISLTLLPHITDKEARSLEVPRLYLYTQVLVLCISDSAGLC